MARVEFHPVFASQYEELCSDESLLELAGEVTQLIDALEKHGHGIEGDAPDDPSHPVVRSRLAMFALRRTPPTHYTPYATAPPVIRIPYVWFTEIENRLVPSWEQAHPSHHAIVRRTR